MGEKPSRTRDATAALVVLGATVYLALVLRNAWVCDDAFVTFRTIDNPTVGPEEQDRLDHREAPFRGRQL